MIDEMKLIEQLEGYKSGWKLAEPFHEGIASGLKIAIEATEKQPKVSGWIPCSDRLPEGCDDAEIELLISTHEAYSDALFEETGFALYYPKTKSFHSVYGNRLEITEIVTAWQYPPAPYNMRKKVE